MSALDRIMDLLNDSEPHKSGRWPPSRGESEILVAVKTLAESGFIAFNETRREARIKRGLREIVLETEGKKPQADIIFIGEESYIIDLNESICFVRERGIRAGEPIFL